MGPRRTLLLRVASGGSVRLAPGSLPSRRPEATHQGGRGSTATIVPGGRAAGGEARPALQRAERALRCRALGPRVCPSQASADSQLPGPRPGRPLSASLASLHVELPSGGRCARPSGLRVLSGPLALTDAPSLPPGPSQASLCASVALPESSSSAMPSVSCWPPLPPPPPAFGHTPSCVPAPTSAPVGLRIRLAVLLSVGPPLTSVLGRGTAGPRGPGAAPPAAAPGGQAGTRSRPASQPRAGSPGMGYFWNVGPAKLGMRRGRPPTLFRTAHGHGGVTPFSA